MPENPLQHSWDLTPVEAVALQQQLRREVEIAPFIGEINTIGGTDISYNKHSDQFYSGIVVLSYPELEVLENSTVVSRAPFPYIPGLLSFREMPSLLEAWDGLSHKPDLVVCDGQGIAHPRRLGIASHFGLVTGTPAIGCAKKRLTGKYQEPEPRRGAWSPLKDKGDIIGFVLVTKDRVKPVFVSPGHRVGLEQSRDIVLACSRGYRLPEPTRQAHLLVNRLRIEHR